MKAQIEAMLLILILSSIGCAVANDNSQSGISDKNDSDHKLWLDKGIDLLTQGDPEGAIAAFNRSIEQNSSDSLAWIGKGNALIQMGRLNESLECFDTALNIEPSRDGKTYCLLAMAQVLKSMGRDIEAAALLELMIKLQADYVPNGTMVADSGFRPESDGFSFGNYGSQYPGKLTSSEMLRLFGPEVFSEENCTDCNLTYPATYWMEMVNDFISGGHCQGLSTLSVLFYDRLMKAADFGANSTHDLSLEENDPLQREIAYWCTMQLVSPARDSLINETPGMVLDTLIEAYRDDDNLSESYTLVVAKPDGRDGHAVTPYAVEYQGNGTYNILVYDNNFPDITRYVQVNQTAGTWSYDDSLIPDPSYEIYTGNASTRSLMLMPISPELKPQDCPFCMNSTASMSYIWQDGEGRLLITDSQDRRLGVVDGQMISEIPGADVIFPMVDINDSIKSPIFEVPNDYITSSGEKIPGSSLNITIDGENLRKASLTNVTLIGPGYVLLVSEINLEPGQKDYLEASPASMLAYRPSGQQSPVIAMAREVNDTDYMFILRGSRLTDGTYMVVGLKDDQSVFSFMPYGTEKAGLYDVYIVRTNDSGDQAFGHEGIEVAGNETAELHFMDWPGNGKAMRMDLSLNSTRRSVELADATDEIKD